MKVGQRTLQFDMIIRRSGNIAGAASSGADIVDRLLHGLGHAGALPHAEIVIGTPDSDIADIAFIRPPAGFRKLAFIAAQIGEDAIAAFRAHTGDRRFECVLIVHGITVTRVV